MKNGYGGCERSPYRLKGKDVVFVKLGRFEMLNPPQARTRAKEIQGDIIKGNEKMILMI